MRKRLKKKLLIKEVSVALQNALEKFYKKFIDSLSDEYVNGSGTSEKCVGLLSND